MLIQKLFHHLDFATLTNLIDQAKTCSLYIQPYWTMWTPMYTLYILER